MPVQTVADIERDPHWRARNLTVSVPNGHEAVRMHNVFPRFSETPGAIEWAGGELGQDNAAVFSELGLDDADLGRLRTTGVIWSASSWSPQIPGQPRGEAPRCSSTAPGSTAVNPRVYDKFTGRIGRSRARHASRWITRFTPRAARA